MFMCHATPAPGSCCSRTLLLLLLLPGKQPPLSRVPRLLLLLLLVHCCCRAPPRFPLTAADDDVNGIHLIGLKLTVLNLGIRARPGGREGRSEGGQVGTRRSRIRQLVTGNAVRLCQLLLLHTLMCVLSLTHEAPCCPAALAPALVTHTHRCDQPPTC